MRRLVTAIGLVTVLVLGFAQGRAQQDSAVTSVLLAPEEIGKGWRTFGERDSLFRSGELGMAGGIAQTYVGPNGSRAVLAINVVALGLANAGAAVNSYDSFLSEHRRSLVDTPEAVDSFDLRQIPNVPGCDRTFRAAGLDPYDFFPVGTTACVTGLNVIVYVAVTGVIVDPQSDQSLKFHHASDHLVAMMATNVNQLVGDRSLSLSDDDFVASPVASPRP